jgi:hypothetical protein
VDFLGFQAMRLPEPGEFQPDSDGCEVIAVFPDTRRYGTPEEDVLVRGWPQDDGTTLDQIVNGEREVWLAQLERERLIYYRGAVFEFSVYEDYSQASMLRVMAAALRVATDKHDREVEAARRKSDREVEG